MHIAICDDNKEEISRICSLIELYKKKHNNLITYDTFTSGIELLETMCIRTYDLLILDIIMPGLTGMDVAKEIRNANSETPIIFLTSSREYAVESYRVDAKDYILKPAHKDELFHTLDKQYTKFAQTEGYITLKTGSSILKFSYSQIVFVEVIHRIVQFNLSNGQVREIFGYLTDYERSLLSDSYFCKPHRSYIVNLRHVIGLDKNGFLTITNKVIPVSRDNFTKIKAVYMNYLLSSNERRDILD